MQDGCIRRAKFCYHLQAKPTQEEKILNKQKKEKGEKARPCPFIQILSRFYPDFILILSKFYPDKIRIKSE